MQTTLRKSHNGGFVLSSDVKAILPELIQQDCLCFLNYLSHQITISDAIIYGSHAQRRAHQWSDIDLAVISMDFVDVSFLRRTILLRKNAVEACTLRVQAIGLTPKQLRNAERPAIITKIRLGMPLLERKDPRRGR